MKPRLIMALTVAATLCGNAHAKVTGDFNDWQSGVNNVQTTSNFGQTQTQTSSFSVGSVNVFTSFALGISQIGQNFATGAWVQGYTGQVLQGGGNSYITLLFSRPITAFSALLTPNYYRTNLMTLSVGGESLHQSVTTTPAYGSGAFFGWSGEAVNSLTIFTNGGPNSIAFGKISIGTAIVAPPVTPVPGPEAGAGLGALAMIGVAYWVKRRRNEKAVAA